MIRGVGKVVGSLFILGLMSRIRVHESEGAYCPATSCITMIFVRYIEEVLGSRKRAVLPLLRLLELLIAARLAVEDEVEGIECIGEYRLLVVLVASLCRHVRTRTQVTTYEQSDTIATGLGREVTRTFRLRSRSSFGTYDASSEPSRATL